MEGLIKYLKNLSHIQADTVIDATGKFVIPGMIDDQVHLENQD